MSLSPYTIDVGPCRADGTRDVFLYCHQRLCFSTTHRGISRVCLAWWPSRSAAEEAVAGTHDATERERLQTERAYEALLRSGSSDGLFSAWPTLHSSAHDAVATAADAAVDVDNATETSPALEQYLCVFHREELADKYGRYSHVQPHTICTAYRLADTTALELVLHNVTPSDFSAAAAGVFVRGHRQSNRAPAPSTAIERHGTLYRPATDLWWMGAPLSLKPVYVARPTSAAPLATTDTARSCDARGVAECEPSAAAAVDEASASVLAASPIIVDDSADGGGGSPFSAGLGGGRTAQGQFDFHNARSSASPLHAPVSASAAHDGAAAATAASCSPVGGSSSFAPLPLPAVMGDGGRSGPVTVGAVVLAQLELYGGHWSDAMAAAGPPTATSAAAGSLAVVRIADRGEIGLATTTPQYALDCMLWEWWPHRVSLPRLSGGNAALSAVSSPHATLDHYIIFLYDALQEQVSVLRTPHLRTGAGAFTVLFTIPCGTLPFAFPPLHAPHPAPIAVCNYPRPNCISVYDVAALLDEASATTATVAMEFDVEDHQARHPELFGPVRTAPGASSPPDAAVEDTSAEARRATAMSWRADGANGVPHSIRSIVYRHANRLVVQYAWPSGAAQPVGVSGAAEESGAVLASSSNGAGHAVEPDCWGGQSSMRHRRRRRCEGTVSYTIDLPAVTRDEHPLLVYVLEALGAALGPRVVVRLEFALHSELWRRACGAASADDAFDTCASLLLAEFRCDRRDDVTAAAGVTPCGDDAIGTAGAATPVFADPSMVSLAQIHRCLAQQAQGSGRGCRALPARAESAVRCEWTREERGVALAALHQLFEACRAQEHLWSLLPQLACLNRDLSDAMGWPGYLDFYTAMAPGGAGAPLFRPSAATLTKTGSPHLPASVPRRHVSTVEGHGPTARSAPSQGSAAMAAPTGTGESDYGDGGVPSLFETLTRMAMRAVTPTLGGAGAASSRTWPLLKGLPAAHPIALANEVVLLYADIFGTAGAASNGAVDATWWERICGLVHQRRLSASVVSHTLSTAAAYPLLEALAKGRECAGPTWPPALLELVGRRDRCRPTSRMAHIASAGQHVVEAAEANAVARQRGAAAVTDDDGVSLRPDFRQTWRDTRLDAVQNLFNTVAPISLVGHEDHPEELTGALELLACRARAMPLGRGMLTMCTQSFTVQDSIPIPPLNLSGRASDGITVAGKATEDLLWPLFHNGCAAGLRFLPLPPAFCAGAPDGAAAAAAVAAEDANAAGAAQLFGVAHGKAAPTITKQWVMYQTKNIGNPASRAGLLLATGILGHLTVLQRTDIFHLLTSNQEQYTWREATTVAVMLGLSCSFCGTGNEAVFRCLSVHVQSLNPSAEDIEVSLDVQTAALVSMGLLCQQAPSSSFLVEVFVAELSRLPTDEHCARRDGYVLGAGFGLGQLLLGVGQRHSGQRVEDRLLAIMTGARRSPTVPTREGVQHLEETMGRGEAGHFLTRALLSQGEREATFHTCASVYEGDCYNVFVSGPAAAMALGMMYLQTGSVFIAARMAPPDRWAALQKLTPLMCHLRSMMASLIHWNAVEATRAWLYAQVPSSLLELRHGAAPRLATQQVNYLLMNLAHCIAGHVMALGLRFAGSMDTAARDVIAAELHGFLAGQIGSTKIAIPTVQRATGAYETCLLACANALSLVMAGTGDVRVLATLQQLHRRTTVSYGSHMAISMSMGLLFLGSGRLTLCNNIVAVAALLMAFYPVWPKDAEDNTYHLQALRHLYGLAVVPRVMEAVDAVSQQPVSVPVRIVLRRRPQQQGSDGGGAVCDIREDTDGAEVVVHAVTPCLYPPAERIERVEVHARQYYPLVFYPISGELTQSASAVLRVMAKDGAAALGGVRAVHARSYLESRLLGWLHRLFRQRTTTTTEALTIIDSVRLVLRVQRQLLCHCAGGALLLSGDFGEAVAEAMERRYAFLFLHGPADVGAATDDAHHHHHHPLRQLVLEGKSPAEVCADLARHPRGSPAFPCDFAALFGDGGSGEDGEAVTLPAGPVSRSQGDSMTDTRALVRWMTEALHYHGLGQQTIAVIRQFLFTRATAASVVDPREATSRSVQRLSTLLRLQSATLLPLHTLEKVWACCMT
ncbi:cyclosome subunit-like protein [Novymonas esmeraldas]|uniref:Cyclosome subunit-like protein n=1 Tax=Novymonas esmeraldas TaxID=1808958 RepID=A0AAW0F490_9TRYP